MSTTNLNAQLAPFVHPGNRNLVFCQIGARPYGTLPDFLSNQSFEDLPPETIRLLEKEIKPLEKRAVLYGENITSSKLTGLFLQALKGEKGTSLTEEVLKKALKIKDQLLSLIQRFTNVHPQLNCLKILTLRLTAHCGRLLKDENFCLLHVAFPSSDSQVSSDTASNFLRKQVALFLNEIAELESWALGNPKDLSESAQKIQALKQSIEKLLHASNPGKKNKRVQESIQTIQTTIELLSGLLLAPQTLIPLAISALGTGLLLEPSQASQEIEKLVELQFYFVSDVIEAECEGAIKGGIEQKGANAKKGKAAIKQFLQSFKEKYMPLYLKIHQSYQGIRSQIYTKSSVLPTHHFRLCQEMLTQLEIVGSTEQQQKAYYELRNLLLDAPSLPKFDVLKQLILNQHLLPFHHLFSRSYAFSIERLKNDLEQFCRAYQHYSQWIPSQQQEMKAGLYTPLDLIYFNILESIALVEKQMDQPNLKLLVKALYCAYQVIVQSKQYYQLSFPFFGEEASSLRKICNEGIKAIEQVSTSSSSIHIASLLEKVESLLGCLNLCAMAPSAYPFLFNFLGSDAIQPTSHEHQLSSHMVNYIYEALSEERAASNVSTTQVTLGEPLPLSVTEKGFEMKDLISSFQQPVTKEGITLFNLDIADENYFQKTSPSDWENLFLFSFLSVCWEDLPAATLANLSEMGPKFGRLITHLAAKRRALAVGKFIIEADPLLVNASLSFLDTFIFLPYQSLSRYIAQRSIDHQAPAIKKQVRASSKNQRPRTTANTTEASTSIEPVLPPIQLLHSSAEQIGQSLALATHALDAASLVTMRDFHAQVVYHLGSIEDLLANGIQELSAPQIQTLLTHEAYALEQSVKLAALARQSQSKPPEAPEALARLLKSSHHPSDFLTFLPMRPTADPAEWKKAFKAASGVDGFLTAPARYALITHPWMGLLADLDEQEDPTSTIKLLDQLIQDNLLTLRLLLTDIHQSLPAPTTPFVASSSATGCLEGLKDKNLLQSPLQIAVTRVSLSASLDHLLEITYVPRLSHYERAAHLAQRKEEIHANLYIIQVSIEQIDTLLQETSTSSWCSSYSSTLLLRAAAVLEKSVQSILFWLPIPSGSDPDLHYLLSTRPASGGRSVSLRHTHSIQDNALLSASYLTQNGETAFAQKLENIGNQFSWLDPFIQQLYRYPFSPIENRSADLLRLFNALSSIRRSLHQGNGIKEALQKELAPSSQNLTTAFDQLIQSHLNAQVIAPVHEILQASQEILTLLVELSKES